MLAIVVLGKVVLDNSGNGQQWSGQQWRWTAVVCNDGAGQQWCWITLVLGNNGAGQQ